MSHIYHDYDLLSQIGNGTFSSVYKAKRKSDGLFVAIKIIEIQNENDISLVSNEANILKSITGGHPTIPRLYDAFADGPFYFIVMEYFDGYITLLDWTNSYVPLIFQTDYQEEEIQDIVEMRESDINEIFAQIISGINYLHSKYVIHRDLKMENIMVNPNTKSIKIIDFGFSKQTEKLQWSTICGSFEYMAPEILQDILKRGTLTDPNEIVTMYNIQSEVWSLGIILYGMIYCRLPFFHANKLKLVNMIIHADISFNPENVIINENLKNLLLCMLDKDPSSRIIFEKVLQHPFFRQNYNHAHSNNQISSQPESNLLLAHTHYHSYCSDLKINKKDLMKEEMNDNDNNKSPNIRLSPLSLRMSDILSSSNDSLPMAFKLTSRRRARKLPQYRKKLPTGVIIATPKI